MPRVDWSVEIDSLRRDNRSGSEEITTHAIELLIDVIGDEFPTGATAYSRWLLRLGRDLVAAQPSMGSVFRLANDLLWACDGIQDAALVRQTALEFLQDYSFKAGAALDQLTSRGVQALKDAKVVLTYSRSSTVLSVLSALAKGGSKLRVLCSEARPMLEGQTLASELGWAGIPVTLGVDMALFGWLDDADALVVGADSVSNEGVVNKIGTAALIKAAYDREIPRLVLCTTFKFLPRDCAIRDRLRGGDPREIMPPSNDKVEVRNIYFDATPLDLVSRVVTEKGPLDRVGLDEELARVRTYKGLRGS